MARFFTLLLFLFPPGMLNAQQHVTYEVRGHIKKFTSGEKVYFLHFANSPHYVDSVIITKRFIDSAIITDGSFSFKGETDISNEPEPNYKESVARLFIDHSGAGINFDILRVAPEDMISIYLEPGVTEVGIADSAQSAVIIPPKINAGHYTLDSIYTAYFKKFNISSREAMLQGLHGTEFMNHVEKYSRIYKAEQKKDMWQFIKDHPSSPVSLYILKHVQEDYPDYNKIEPYFSTLSDTLKNTAFGKQYTEMLNRLKSIRVGAQAPEFTMNDATGKPVSLSSFKGKYILIDFWASWCGPCRHESPSLVKAYEQFKDQNFTILGVSLDKAKDAWLKAVYDDQLNWTQVSDLRFWQNAAAQLYSVKAIPQNFLIDPQGKIIAKNLFGKRLTEHLTKIFNKTNQASN